LQCAERERLRGSNPVGWEEGHRGGRAQMEFNRIEWPKGRGGEGERYINAWR